MIPHRPALISKAVLGLWVPVDARRNGCGQNSGLGAVDFYEGSWCPLIRAVPCSSFVLPCPPSSPIDRFERPVYMIDRGDGGPGEKE